MITRPDQRRPLRDIGHRCAAPGLFPSSGPVATQPSPPAPRRPFAVSARFAFLAVLVGVLLVSAGAWAGGPSVVLAVFGSDASKAHQAYENFIESTRQAHPGLDVRLAHTAKTLHQPLPGNEAPAATGPAGTIDALANQGADTIVVQSLHVLAGKEYESLARDVEAARRRYPKLRLALGKPLLATASDVPAVAQAVMDSIPAERAPGEAVIACVHGSTHDSAALYGELARLLAKRDPLVVLAAIEGEPSFDAALADVAYRAPAKAWLLPLLTISGAHVAADVAGPGPGSWASRLKSAGIAPILIDKGLAEQPAFVALWQQRLDSALAGSTAGGDKDASGGRGR